MWVLWLAFLTAIRPLTLTTEVLVKTWYYRQRYSPLRRCQDQLETATTYTEWATAAHELDILQGHEAWKNDPASPDYDFALVQARIAQLREALATNDLAVLMFLARTFVARNLGRMSNPALYTHTHIGTKRLVDEYHGQVISVLQHVLDSPCLALDAKYEFFTQLRQAYGRTALLLSGGASFGLFHIGVLKALFACRLLPRVVSGSSSGSIMAAMLCTRTDGEVLDLLDPHKNRLNLDVFEAPERAAAMTAAGIGVSWVHRVTHLLKHGSLYESEVLIKSLRENIGEMTFLEAYNRTRRILNITVSTSTVFENQRLLNYLTAPNVVIWSAVAASCAAPFLFPPAPILAKNNVGQYVQWDGAATEWIDGSVQHDLPMQRLSELFNINHFIVSQVNPYVVPFMHLTHPPSALLTPPRLRPTVWATSSAWRSLTRVLARLVADEVRYRAYQLQTLGIFPHLMFRLQAILAQKYSGDITIVPDFRLADYRGVIINPTPADFDRYATLGERATWPKISIIRNHCEVELFLDKVIYQLRTLKLEMSASLDPINAKSSSSKSKRPKQSRTTVTTPVITPTTELALPTIAGSYFSLPAQRSTRKRREWNTLAQPSLAPLSPLVTQQSARAAIASVSGTHEISALGEDASDYTTHLGKNDAGSMPLYDTLRALLSQHGAMTPIVGEPTLLSDSRSRQPKQTPPTQDDSAEEQSSNAHQGTSPSSLRPLAPSSVKSSGGSTASLSNSPSSAPSTASPTLPPIYPSGYGYGYGYAAMYETPTAASSPDAKCDQPSIFESSHSTPRARRS